MDEFLFVNVWNRSLQRADKTAVWQMGGLARCYWGVFLWNVGRLFSSIFFAGNLRPMSIEFIILLFSSKSTKTTKKCIASLYASANFDISKWIHMNLFRLAIKPSSTATAQLICSIVTYSAQNAKIYQSLNPNFSPINENATQNNRQTRANAEIKFQHSDEVFAYCIRFRFWCSSVVK